MSVAAQIEQEERLSQNLLRTRGPMSFRKAEAVRDFPPPSTDRFPPEAFALPPEFRSAPVSAAIYRLISNEFTIQPDQPITYREISEARAYTSTLLGVDLSAVRVEVVPVHEWDEGATVEGFQVPVGVRDHLVFVPDMFMSPQELLCHELAHAGHTTAQRLNGELPYFSTAPLTAELVAHYCQYNYLLEHKDRAHFVGALMQLMTASYALAIYASGIHNDFGAFLKAAEAREIREALPRDVLESTYRTFQTDRRFWHQEVMRGVSNILALLLVDEHEGMRRFISADRIDQTLEAKLIAAFPNVDLLTSFGNVNDQLFMLLERFNS